VHELSLCRSIRSIAEEARAGRTLLSVHLQVGQLRQVVPQTLEYCWELVTDGTPLSGSALVIDHVPVVLECISCAATTTVAHQLVLTCAACGSGAVQMLSGEEFMVTSVDVVPVDSALVDSAPVNTAPIDPTPQEV
jgi:hydrogenase nickel incorporation protein HypA/HybF